MFICIEKSPFLSPVQGEGGVKKKEKRKTKGKKEKHSHKRHEVAPFKHTIVSF